MKVLVTGANGFLGQRVVAGLLKQGQGVRALVRPSTDLAPLNWPEAVEIVRADLTTDGLDPAFQDVDVLIHLAASMRGNHQEQHASTVGGTERLLDAMTRSSTKRLVLASSLSVYDWSAISATLDESSPLEQDPSRRDAYASAKIEQERLVRRVATEQGWALTVLRPGFIWGPGQAYPPGLGQKVGPIHLVIGPSTRLPLTYVENCASVFVEAATNPRAVGETFNVIDNDDRPSWAYLGDHLRGSGRRGFRVPVPYGLALTASRLGHATLGKVMPRLPGLLIPSRFEARFKPVRFGTSKLREVLGWTSPLNRDECLTRTYGSGVLAQKSDIFANPIGESNR